jgi:hypothetical protein
VSLGTFLRSERPREILGPTLSPVTVDWNLGFVSETAKSGLAYWASLCSGRKMPGRQELSPSRMRGFLQHVTLVNVVRESQGGAMDFVVTLQGQHNQDIYGPVAHRRLRDALPAHLEQRWRDGLELATNAARPVRLSSRMSVDGKSWLAGEVLIAPLGDERHGVEALFAVLASWPEHG